MQSPIGNEPIMNLCTQTLQTPWSAFEVGTSLPTHCTSAHGHAMSS